MGKKKTFFDESLENNMETFYLYYNRLKEIAISRFKWLNLPDSVDPRYLELCLFENGNALFFKDSEMGYLTLSDVSNGNFDVYGEPLKRRAYSRYNNYQRQLNYKNSTYIWNNMLRTGNVLEIQSFAKRLYNLDRIIDVNANAQKTPVLVLCDEKERLTMKNLYQQFDGNAPVIFGDKALNVHGVQVLKTDAPFICDKIYELKTQIWNEALTYLGIPNVAYQKRERLVSDEVTRGLGGTLISRKSALTMREEACRKINNMFGLNVEVEFQDCVNSDDSEVLENE